jgi:hypothetical protein
MALVTHFDLELHLNGDLEENVYTKQPKGFVEKEKNI